jgi:hypothetical protein
MSEEPSRADSSLRETMAARIGIKELGDPAGQKEINDAVEALDRVIEIKIKNAALYVSRSASHIRKENRAGYSLHRTSIKAAATDTKAAHPDLPTPRDVEQTGA